MVCVMEQEKIVEYRVVVVAAVADGTGLRVFGIFLCEVMKRVLDLIVVAKYQLYESSKQEEHNLNRI